MCVDLLWPKDTIRFVPSRGFREKVEEYDVDWYCGDDARTGGWPSVYKSSGCVMGVDGLLSKVDLCMSEGQKLRECLVQRPRPA